MIIFANYCFYMQMSNAKNIYRANSIVWKKICPMGKQHRKPFKSSSSCTTGVLQLIHSDLCGPMENKSLGGCKYMMTFTDDFSRKTFVRFLLNKNSATVSNMTSTFIRLQRDVVKNLELTIRRHSHRLYGTTPSDI